MKIGNVIQVCAPDGATGYVVSIRRDSVDVGGLLADQTLRVPLEHVTVIDEGNHLKMWAKRNDIRMDSKIREGDTVTIREWDDMAAEFGSSDTLDDAPVIRCEAHFITKMRKYCGRDMVVRYVRNPDRFDLVGEREFVFSNDMLEKGSLGMDQATWDHYVEEELCDAGLCDN